MGLLPVLFLGRSGHSHRACGPLIPRAVKKMKRRVDFKWGGCGCHDVLLLELAGFADASWQKCDNPNYFFACKNTKGKLGRVQFLLYPT
jgi:hypothetical protein